jgi:hypothetical protein
MKRPARVALELLAPPAVASVLFALVMAARTGEAKLVGALPFILVFAYVTAGIPAVAFTAILEVAYARGLDAGSWRAVRLAALLGLPCGCALALLFSGGLQNAGEAFAVFPALGVATGAIVGAVVRARSR